MKKVVLFPIETSNREVDYRAWLAAMLASDGLDVLMGQQDVVYRSAATVGGGIYLGQNIRTSEGGVSGNMVRYRRLKESRFSVVHLDEEGGVLLGRGPADWERELLHRFDARELAADDAMCVWGPFQEKVYRGVRPQCSVRATGHPRFDLCAAEFRPFFYDDVAEIRQRLGPFVLVNTSFARANHHQGIRQVFSDREHYFPERLDARLRSIGFWALQSHGLVDFVDLVHRIAAEAPQRKIVVRRHPSESETLYETVFRGVQNVYVIHDGSVSPWILAADVVIFDSCTTGIEAWALGRNAISYRPHSGHVSVALPALFGRECRSVEDVASALAEISRGDFIGPSLSEERLAEVRQVAMNLGTAPSAFAGVREVVAGVSVRAASPRPNWERALAIRERARVAKQNARGVARRLFSERQRAYEAHRSKFQGVSPARMVQKVERAARLQNTRVDVTVLSDDLIIVRGSGR
jgi:surface carbohydrate biosynthesis protein